MTATVVTGMAAGTYCDLLTGGTRGATCAGTSVEVSDTGRLTLSLGANSAIAFDVTTRVVGSA